MIDFRAADIVTDKDYRVGELLGALREEDFRVSREGHDSAVCAGPSQTWAREEKPVEPIAHVSKDANRPAFFAVGMKCVLEVQDVQNLGLNVTEGSEVDQDIETIRNQAFSRIEANRLYLVTPEKVLLPPAGDLLVPLDVAGPGDVERSDIEESQADSDLSLQGSSGGRWKSG